MPRLMARHPALVVWFLFVCSVPFYVGRSGMPQPGNALLIVLLPLAFAGWNGRLELRQRRILRMLVFFVVWVWIVNFGWGLVSGKLSLKQYGIVPFYYTFNAIIVFSALALARRYGDGFLRVTFYATAVMAVFQVAVSTVYRGHASGIRATLFFNNPNQLGYWALLAATVIALCYRRLRLPMVPTLSVFFACVYLSVLSGSRAATGGVLILAILLVVSSPRVLVMGALASVALLAFGGDPSGALDTEGLQALQRGGRSRSFADERAYSRIWDFKEYVIIGAGEGDYQRFAAPGKHANEIHSTIGTVVFCYGLLGAALFLQCFLFLFRGLSFATSILILPVVMYSVAHQGLRFSMFWIVFALFAGLETERRRGLRDQRRPIASRMPAATPRAS